MRERILVIIPSIFGAKETLRSLNDQTLKPTEIIVTDKRFNSPFQGVRIAKAINSTLATVNLDDYDWILRTDDDIVLPSNFLALNSSVEADIVGAGGTIMLKSSALKRLKRWPEFPLEDSNLLWTSKALGLTRGKQIVDGKTIRKQGTNYSNRMMIEYGKETWKLGYIIPLIFLYLLNALVTMRDLRWLAWFYGYVFQMFKQNGSQKYPVWEFVHRSQVEATRMKFLRLWKPEMGKKIEIKGPL